LKTENRESEIAAMLLKCGATLRTLTRLRFADAVRCFAVAVLGFAQAMRDFVTAIRLFEPE